MSDASPAGASRAPNPVLAALGRVLEGALNRIVDLDADTRDRVAALEGRAITLDIKDTALAARIEVERGRLHIGPAFAGESALHVLARPGSLFAIALGRRKADTLPPGKLEIAGDAELARDLNVSLDAFGQRGT